MQQSIDEIFYCSLAMRTQSADTIIEKKGKTETLWKQEHRNTGETQTSCAREAVCQGKAAKQSFDAMTCT